MNKIFKVIFSKAKGCYVVVSELAKSAGKGTSASHTQRGYKLTLAAAVLSMMMGMAPVGAVDPVVLGNNGASAYYDAKGNLTIGDAKTMAEGKNQNGKNNTTIGTQTDTLRNVTEGDTKKDGQPLDGSNTILVDGEGKAHPLDLSTEAGGSTAVGYQSRAEGDNSTAIGNNAKITNKPVTYYVDADGKKTASLENAVWYKDSSGNPTKVPQVFRDADGNKTTTPQYVHTYTEKDPDTKEDVTKTEITSDAGKADQKDGQPVYNYQKSDNTPYLYTVTLYQAASNSIAAGTSVTANGSNAVALGYNSGADNSAVAIGDTAAAVENAVAIGKNTKATAKGSIALGKGSEADRDGGVAGWDPKTGTASTKSDVAWQSGEGALSIGNGGASRQITNVAAGSEDSDAVNLAQLKEAIIHYYSVKTTEATDAAGGNNYLNDGATGNNALAAGVSAVATGDNATAVGTNTYASGTNASAYGYRAVASGSGSVAIGSGTSAQQEGSVAIGGHTQGSHAVQVGTDSTAESAYSVAVGGYAKGDYSVEVGHGSTAQGSYSTSIGGHAIGKNSIAIGSEMQGNYSNPASAGGDNSIAIGGHTNSINDIAIGAGSSTNGGKGGQAIAVGGSAMGEQAVSIGGVATNSSATAVGRNSSATGSQSTAVGGHAGNVYSTAVGQGANATYAYTTAVGNNSTASGSYSTALGYGTSAQGSSTTAIGGANANGTNLTVIGKGSTASASSRYDTISNSTAIGGAHISASDAAAIGSNATVNGQYGVALGYNSNVSYQSTGVGTGTKASNTGTAVGYGAQSSGYQSAAVGASSNATGQNAVSLGGGGAWGDYSIALGSGAGTNAHAIALGQNSGAWGENAIAIGEGTNAWRANSIVLGKNSKSGADKNIEGYDPRTGVASVDDTSTWYSTDEAVSIGRAEERDGKGNITVSAITRQLNNLAAGTLDTDAVNVAQLKAATQKVNMHDYSVWSPDTETDTNYTNGGAVAKNSMAAGVSAGATGENAVAIGYGAQAKGRSATVIGKNASATGQYAMAFGGLDTTDKNGNPVTMTNTASGASATAFGQGAQAKGAASLAFGHNTVAGVDGGGQQSVAFGEDTQALGGRSLAFGEKTIAKYNDSVAFGNDTRASSTGATAFGNRTRALSSYSTAWGNATVAADEESTAWGTDTIAGAKLDENGAVTNKYTEDNTAKTEQMDVHGNLAYVRDGKTAGIKQMKIDSGDELHDYVVLAGKDGNTYVRDYQGSLWKVNVAADGTVTVDTTAGKNGKVYNGKNGAKESLAKTTVKDAEVAITPDNVLTKAHEGSNGYNIDGYANATAFGYSTEASGDNATAFGNDTKASAAGATAFGYQTLASGENSTAFGENSIAAAKNSLAALGGTVAESATNAAAIGNGAQAKLADSVALGSGALANRSGGSKGYDVLTGNATTETSAAWVANANAIAIGNDTEGSLLTRQITGVAAGSLDTDAVNVAQLKAAGLGFTTNTKDASNTTDNYKGYKVVSRKLGDTIAIKASDETDNHSYSTKNLTTRIAENGDISILMDENPAFTSVTTSDVIFAGNPDLTDKDGKAAKADTNVHYGAKTLTDSQNITTSGNDPAATRLHYKDEQGHTYELATMDDGQIYAGDIKTDGTADSTGFARRMNEKTIINGGVTDKDSLTDGNIGVVSNGTDTLTVKLAKDLKDLTSVTTGKTVMNDSGIKITNDAADEIKNVVINGDKISYGGNQVTNMGSGADGTADGKPTYNTNTNGANIGDVKNIASSTTDAAKLTGDSNITVTYNDPTADGKNTVKLNDSITLGSDADKKVTIDGTAGTITAGGKVSLDGSTGTGSIGGVTIGNQTSVATTKMDGDKAKTEDGTFVTGLTNRTWNPDTNGIVSGRAATEDQLKAVSDTVNAGWELDVNGGKQKDVTPTSRKVNFKQGQNITISGSGDDVTVATADNVRFASVRVGGDADGKGGYTGGIVIGQQSGLKADGKPSANPNVDYYITGLKNTNWDSEKIQSGRAATEDQLKLVADEIKNGTVAGDVFVTGGGIKYNGEHDASDTTSVNNGKGSLKLTLKNQDEPLSIDGLHDYYATSGTVSADGKTLTIARNEKDAEGKPVTFDVDLTNLLNKEKHLIANPADGSQGVYKVNEQGEVTLQVQDAAGNNTPVTISGLDGVKGLNFDANTKKTSDGKVHNVKLGGTIKVQGVDPVTGHDYSADNVTTEVDDNGNITIKLDKALTADTVMVNGKDGRDGQIGLNGKDGKDGTVTTIIRTIGKNGTDGTDGKPGVNGTDGITRIVYQDGKDGETGTTTHTVATLDDGLKFGANHPVVENGANPVGNKLNSTINITGAGTKNLQDYSGKNLLTSVEQDASGNTTIHVLMDRNISADGVTVGQAGTDGVKGENGEVGQAGTIGINGKNGVKGDGGKEGITTTIIRTEKGQPGKDGVNGKPGVDGTDITRIVYQNSQDSQDGTDGKDTHTVATLDDGLKFAGDDGQNDASKVITKKLNERLDIVGKAQGDLTDANIGVTKDKNGKLYIQLAKHVDLDEGGTLQAGDATIGAFSNTDLTTNKKNHPVGGSYVTGLSNTDWNVSDPEYVSGRAATEDQLDKISKAINNAATAAGKRTVVTVNDKSNPATADPGANAYGEYNTQNGNLMIAAMRDSDGAMTYNIKLNDQLAIGQKGDPGVAGKDGKDGKVTVETKGGTTVVIGHDGEPDKDGKDGLFVTGKDGADGVSITGPNGADGTDGKVGISGTDGKDAVSISGHNGEGHIGLTGPKGADGTPGKDGISIDITTDLKTATLDDGKNVKTVIKDKDGKDTTITQAPRIQYDSNGKSYEVATMDDGQKYAGDFGNGASVKLNKTVTIKGKVKDGAKEDDFVDGNIAVVANKSQNGEDGELLIKLNKDLTGLNSATYTTSTKNGDVTTTSTTVVDGTGLKIDNGPSITNAGIDGGKHQITNVASGKDGKMYDTAVEGHGNWNNAANIGDVTNIAKSAADGVQAKSGKNITVDANNKVNLNDNITLGDDKDKTKQVSIDGNGAKITAGDGDNKVTVDGSKGQIVAGGDNGVKIGNIAGGDSSLTIYDKDGNATNKKADGGNYVTNLGNKTWNADGTGSYVSGRAATEDQLHQVESNVNKQIADVNTKIDKVDKHHTEVTVNGGTPAKADGAYTDGNLQLKQKTGEDGQKVYDLKLNDQLKVGQKGDDGKAGKDGNVTVEAKGGTTVVIGHDGKDGKDGRDGLFVTGKDGKDGKSGVSITGPNGVAGRDGVDGKVGIAGKDGRDAVSIAGRDGVGHIGLTGPKGADGKDGTNIDISTVLGKGTLDRNQNEVKGEDKDGTKDQAARIQYQTTVKEADGTTKPITHEVATMDDGMKYGDDFGNTAKVKLNHQLDIVGDINAGKKNGDKKATKDDLSDGNIGIVATDTVYNDDGTVKENGKMTVKLAKDLKGLNSIESNSVTTGNTTINNGGLTIKTGDANRNITVQDGNVNMGGNQIHHVAPGQAPDDAVNVSQLNATNYAVNKLDTRVNRVGANAAALAALHPLDFDPDDKWDFSAGYGHYKDANAAAVGAFYRPNEDTMFSVGGSFGGGENMVNAGISVKLGQGNHVSTSRVAMAKEIKDLKKDVAALKAVVNQQSALIDKLTGVNAGELSGSDDLFPDVPANHWAYEYVTRLKQAGILTGYPDGNFAGDRMMTRYEFATIVYRAIMAGAAANPSLNKDGTLDRLAKEFSSEMKYIRIDTIRKDRNGRPTIQRVRVIKEDEKEK